MILVRRILVNFEREPRNASQMPRVKTEEVLRVGDIVLIKEENTTRGCWKLARIIQLSSSDDKLIRSVKLKLRNGKEIVRPIDLLYPVEISRQFAEFKSKRISIP